MKNPKTSNNGKLLILIRLNGKMEGMMFPELGRRGCPTGIMIIEKAATAKIIQNGEAEILEVSMAS